MPPLKQQRLVKCLSRLVQSKLGILGKGGKNDSGRNRNAADV